MKLATKIWASVFAVVSLLAASPIGQQYVSGLLAKHPAISSIFAGLSALLALFHNPKASS